MIFTAHVAAARFWLETDVFLKRDLGKSTRSLSAVRHILERFAASMTR